MTTKYLLKQAARGIVPDRIIDKPKVGFFNAAVGAWFRGAVRGAIADYLLAPNAGYAQLLERAEVERLVTEHAAAARRAPSMLLLSILMLEVWLADVLPRALAPPEPGRERVVVA